MERQLNILIQQYLDTDTRVDKLLYAIITIFKSKPSLIDSTIQKTKTSLKALQVLKILMLINKCIITQVMDQSNYYNWLGKIKVKAKTQLDYQITEKLINPYLMYLKKRSKNIEQQFYQQPDYQFSIINMMNICLGFTKNFVTFCRYFGKKLNYFVDLNIILAIDMKILYQQITKNIKLQKKINVFKQLQSIHEILYLIYYNCYFYKYTSKYAPKWINTDDMEQQFQIIKKNWEKKNTTLDESTKKYQNEQVTMDIGGSIEISNTNVGRIGVIKSMERILELFD